MLLNGDSAYSFKRLVFLTLLFSSFSVCRLPSNTVTCWQVACLASWLVSYFLCMEGGKGGSLRNKNETGWKNTLQTPFPLQQGLRLTLCTCGAESLFLCAVLLEKNWALPDTRGDFLSSAPVSAVLGNLTAKNQVHALCRLWEKPAFQK